MLGSHGLFTWGNTSYESYVNTLDIIERCANYLENNYEKKGVSFGGVKINSLPTEEQAGKGRRTRSGFKRVLFFSNKNDRAFYR